jgi:2-methylcitrate dehydratase PrpD
MRAVPVPRGTARGRAIDPGYERAFLDWLACAAGGWSERAAVAARWAGSGLSGQILALGTAGHVLDFDDTYLPGLVHLSAPTAPVALALGAENGATVGEVLAAYAAGFEAMAALARASHPALYDRGWHPTAVCGVVGSATVASRLLGVDPAGTRTAVRLALLAAGGLRAAFGSDGKSLQVGMAAASGLRAARLAAGGAEIPDQVATAPAGFEEVYGGRWSEPQADASAISENWIKAYPCCLQTHSAIEAADQLRGQVAESDAVVVTVHPVARQAAPYDDVRTGLEAKFSIPYTVAFTLLHGVPTVADFGPVDEEVRRRSHRIEVREDARLLESEALVTAAGGTSARVEAALGSPARPMDRAALASKVRTLAGDRLDGALDDHHRAARSVLERLR